MCESLYDFLSGTGHIVTTATNPYRALQLLEEFDPRLILTDLRMPGLDGLSFIEQARRAGSRSLFVVMTAHSSVSRAVEALKAGAEDFIEKPFRLADLGAMVETAMRRAELLAESRSQEDGAPGEGVFSEMVGRHPSMLEMFETIRMVAPVRASVLITGESGTGKGLVANLVHRLSARRDRAMVDVNCAALAEPILESELFGHERGAFTGAVARRDGRFMQAEGSTLYLDEVAELRAPMQAKLLRVLQEKRYERVGSNKTLAADVRLIASTNRDIDAEVEAGRFRTDLFYRINVVRLQVTPLRERRSDIPLLAALFLKRSAQANQKPLKGFSGEVMNRLIAYDWPGNVRELEHAIEHSVVLSPEGPQLARLPDQVLKSGQASDLSQSTIREIEREAILNTLASVSGNTARAAEILGISRRKIQYRLREYQE
jgi:DNA-binding NtrC family response regulator